MDLSKSINFLLENAGPVIQYRLHKEILKDISQQDEEKLLDKVYQMPHFKLLQSYTKPNGYIGIGMHSGAGKYKQTYLQDGEAAARLLSYYSVPKAHPIILNFIAAMRDDDVLRQEFSYSKPEIDRFNNRFAGLHNGASGSGAGLMVLMYTMQSLLGYGDDEYVFPFQEISLKAFKSILPFSSLDDMSEFNPNLKKKYNCPFIQEDAYMPCSYHLSTLAYTNRWRTDENCQAMADAINHICVIMKDGNSLAVKIGGRYYGSLWMLLHPIKPFSVENIDTIMYRRVLSEIAMLGVGRRVDVLRRSEENLSEALSKDGILQWNFTSPYQKQKCLSVKWPTAYCDPWLEADHKRQYAISCDLTFWAVQFLTMIERSK